VQFIFVPAAIAATFAAGVLFIGDISEAPVQAPQPISITCDTADISCGFSPTTDSPALATAPPLPPAHPYVAPEPPTNDHGHEPAILA